ncbi:MAG: hypothetical protein AAGF36_16500 [Pseudomonadota bacterium]
MASVASAQSNRPINVFFGFDFVLHPIAIKWACKGERDQDLATFARFIAAFPEDAKSAELQSHIDALQQVSEGDDGLRQIWGRDITSEHAEKLCNAARLLSVAWATPEQLANGDNDGMPSEQIEAWAEFWKVVERLQ